MFHDLDIIDRRTRRNTAFTRRQGARRYVLTGEKDFYDTTSPADFREFRTVVGYGKR
ncbi:hypothetical protein [Actinoplanes aureus]|uniref:Uncharacterized protein n=1 Tax=Actinoplanes aureus TaxID=2792083 RepID=A0A931CM94_9ACTN|nr:hypothetical protein [Actinoplanes aureus]MBG0567520.1 hypothetical protein [Actinoplanes aureus]